MALVPVQLKRLQLDRSLRPTAMSAFRAILPDKAVLDYCKQSGVEFRDRMYTPLLTFWAFVAQCLDPDHSCRKAVSYVLSWRRSGKAPRQRRNRKRGNPSDDTGGYCKARQRLPEELVCWAMRTVAYRLGECVGISQKMWGKDIYLVDGTCVSMPDEKPLAEEFGRSGGGKRGCKKSLFPIARIVSLISLTTGAVIDAAIGSYKTSEHALFHGLWTRNPEPLRGSVIVGDRLFCSYSHLAQLPMAGIDLITRLHGRRPADMRQGKCLGPGDRLVTWQRPKLQPKWLSKEEFLALPEQLTVRMIRGRSLRRGFRPKHVVIVTTLTDPELYSAQDIANLFLRRWDIEVDMRHIKSVLQMDVLRGKSPDIVRKEIWAHLTVYNLARAVMWEAAASHDFSPSGTEFQRNDSTAQYLRAMHRKCPLFKLVSETVEANGT